MLNLLELLITKKLKVFLKRVFPDFYDYYLRYRVLALHLQQKNVRIQILSFGCSKGDECWSLRNYFPDAEIIGYDVNENIIKIAIEENHSCNVVFTSDISFEEFEKQITELSGLVKINGFLIILRIFCSRIQKSLMIINLLPFLNIKIVDSRQNSTKTAGERKTNIIYIVLFKKLAMFRRNRLKHQIINYTIGITPVPPILGRICGRQKRLIISHEPSACLKLFFLTLL